LILEQNETESTVSHTKDMNPLGLEQHSLDVGDGQVDEQTQEVGEYDGIQGNQASSNSQSFSQQWFREVFRAFCHHFCTGSTEILLNIKKSSCLISIWGSQLSPGYKLIVPV